MLEETNMKKSTLTLLPICILIFILLVTACSAPTSQSEPEQLAEIVSRTQTAIAVVEVATAAVEQPVTTPTVTLTLPVEVSPTTSPTTESSPTPTTSPTPQPSDCTNLARFVDETVPDKTSYSANKSFTKTWTLRNMGTCTWTPDYSLVFVDGDQMGATVASPINQAVPPDGTIEISINLVAPQSSGAYKGNWKLRTPGGLTFGLGSNGEKAFWVQINVVETSGELNLGSPTWTDNFDSDSGYWPLGEDAVITYELSNGKLVMTGNQITGDQWRMNAQPGVKNLYLEVTFQTGDKCSGKDSYGIIIRSTDTGDDVFDSGYVFTFSCDGMYRLYRMDNGTFVSLLNWTASSDIKTGQNATNKMGFFAEDQLIKLYANGNRLAQVSDSGHERGKWGLVIRAKETSGFEVSVDDVSYWILGD